MDGEPLTKQPPPTTKAVSSTSNEDKESTIAAQHSDSSTATSATATKKRSDGRLFVPKNSLTEEMLLADRERARAVLKRKRKEEITPEDIAEERKTSNRLSEFLSRQRRKRIVDDLKKTAQEQSEHSATQAKQIAELQIELQAVRQENAALRQQLQMQNQGQGAPLSLPNLDRRLSLAHILHSGNATGMSHTNIALASQLLPTQKPQPQQPNSTIQTLIQELLRRPASEAGTVLQLLQQLVAISQQQQDRSGNGGTF